LDVVAAPPVSLLWPRLDLKQFCWWAEDDLGNWYLGTSNSGRSDPSDGHNEFPVTYQPGLHPHAPSITIRPTGPAEQANITVAC
jgi:hypothetical protein